jgi:hypothetical protein
MIKKIDIDYDSPCRLRQEYGQKINELCDVINTIQKEREAEWFEIQEWIGILEAVRKSVNIHEKQIDKLQTTNTHIQNDLYEMRHSNTKTRAENMQDKFAEQRQWIGCVCRFWFDNPNDTLLDYLDKIQTGKNGVEYYAKESGDWFPHCEPVLPTDNAIYKGGDNE